MTIRKIGCEGCDNIVCPSTKDVLKQDVAKGVKTGFHRVDDRGMSACLFGSTGVCCRNCNMGPCQIIDGVEMVGVVAFWKSLDGLSVDQS